MGCCRWGQEWVTAVRNVECNVQYIAPPCYIYLDNLKKGDMRRPREEPIFVLMRCAPMTKRVQWW